MGRPRINQERDAQILALIAEGKSSSWIGRQFNMTRSRVQQIAAANGAALTFRGSVEFREFCRANLARARAEGKMGGRHDHPDHDSRVAAIQRAAAEGRSYGQVAKELGVTRNTVAGLASRHKIRFGAAA